ncbi:MAG TPA: hypothetical protein VHB25_14760 [Gemmatimonadaceae bacterium]|nr:hypothetical protein [Gemmatimonadaceae bacterium]
MRTTLTHAALAALLAIPLASPALGAQVIDLTTHDNGLAIGDKPRVNGLRLNFRDRHLEAVNGVNLTIWSPYDPASGRVNGLALGLPATGAADIHGIGLGILGLGTTRNFTGIGVGGIGVGTGGEAQGIFLGGVGVGAGGNVTGISVAGVGVGGGGSLRGIQIGGIGVGGGGSLTGLSVGGIGVGGGGDVTGIAIGGVGVGGAGRFKGIGIGGIGVGTGGDVTGLVVGGVGVGSGGTLRGLSIGGIGVGAPRIRGVVIGGIGAGGDDVHAIALSGAYFRIADDGRFDGGSLAAVNRIGGAQHGLTLGLFNYARELDGVQIGLINVSDNGGRRRILPLLSVR